MLVIKRKVGQAFLIGGNVLVKLLGTQRGSAEIGIDAPTVIPVMREELLGQPGAPAKRPRYTTRTNQDDFSVFDTLKGESICTVSVEALASQIAQDLNRGIVETVTPDGRWTEEEPTL